MLIFFGPVKWFGWVKVLPLLDQISSEVQGTFGMTVNNISWINIYQCHESVPVTNT